MFLALFCVSIECLVFLFSALGRCICKNYEKKVGRRGEVGGAYKQLSAQLKPSFLFFSSQSVFGKVFQLEAKTYHAYATLPVGGIKAD